MNNNETYTYKQILLGLRIEYVKAQKILDELSNYTYNRSKLMDYHFRLWNDSHKDNNPELLLGKKTKDDKQLFNLLYTIFGKNILRCTTMLSDNNGFYYPKDKGYNIVIKDEQKFKEEVEKLLSSDFAKYMSSNSLINAINSEAIPRILLRYFKIDLRSEKSVVVYHGREDVLEIASRGKNHFEPLTQEYLNYMLELEFFKKDFSEYHQKIIEQNIDNDKKIILYDGYKPEMLSKFNIKEDSKKLILTKK